MFPQASYSLEFKLTVRYLKKTDLVSFLGSMHVSEFYCKFQSSDVFRDLNRRHLLKKKKKIKKSKEKKTPYLEEANTTVFEGFLFLLAE